MHDYELQISKSYDEVFELIIVAAKKFGKVLDENKLLGHIHFKKGISWVGIPANYIIAVKKIDENNTEIKTQVQPTMGYTSVTMNQEIANKAYTAFIKVLSGILK